MSMRSSLSEFVIDDESESTEKTIGGFSITGEAGMGGSGLDGDDPALSER
jgi:hypothetical protein